MPAHRSAEETKDELQARFLACLRESGGRPLTFEELRARGFENPAVLSYELEVEGIALTRVEPRAGRAGAVALAGSIASDERQADARARRARPRLQLPHLELSRLRTPLQRLAAQHALPGEASVRRRLIGRIEAARAAAGSVFARASRQALIGAVLLLAILAVIGWALALSRGGGPAHGASTTSAAVRKAAHDRARRAARAGSRAAASPGAPPAGRSQTTTTTGGGATAPAPALTLEGATASATEREAAGHRLLKEGRYTVAIAQLRAALEASGGSLQRCAQPAGEACLTYAYALFDLGRALMLRGSERAAVEVLEQRLRIDNQREVVQGALAMARQRAGSASS